MFERYFRSAQEGLGQPHPAVLELNLDAGGVPNVHHVFGPRGELRGPKPKCSRLVVFKLAQVDNAHYEQLFFVQPQLATLLAKGAAFSTPAARQTEQAGHANDVPAPFHFRVPK
jgi:hypothetical protein